MSYKLSEAQLQRLESYIGLYVNISHTENRQDEHGAAYQGGSPYPGHYDLRGILSHVEINSEGELERVMIQDEDNRHRNLSIKNPDTRGSWNARDVIRIQSDIILDTDG